MDVFTWGALFAAVTIIVTLAGYIVKVTLRISAAEAKADLAQSRADMAGINVAANTIRVETVAKLLSEHKERIAQDYVSHRSLEQLENRLVDAITRLGDRLDKLFVARPTTA